MAFHKYTPQCAYAACLEQECRPVLQRLASPSHGQGTQHMAVRYNQHVAVKLLVLGRPNDGLVPFLADFLNQAI
jgi:hypothetical protein